MPRQLTPQVLRQIDHLAKNGYTRSQIAREVGCDRHTVARHLPARSVVTNDAQELPPNDVALLRALAATLLVATCGQCGQKVVGLKSMRAGRCPHCDADWQIASQAAARR